MMDSQRATSCIVHDVCCDKLISADELYQLLSFLGYKKQERGPDKANVLYVHTKKGDLPGSKSPMITLPLPDKGMQEQTIKRICAQLEPQLACEEDEVNEN